jgi:inorganic pyrophosphatase
MDDSAKAACRPVGIIEGEDGDKNDAECNDRIVCVENGNHSYTHVRHMDDLGRAFKKEFENFLVNYHQLSGKSYRSLGLMKSPAQAPRQVKACRRAAGRRRANARGQARRFSGQILSIARRAV